MGTQSKGRRIAAWILTGLIGVLFVFSSVFKFTRGREVMDAMAKWGLEDKVMLIGIGELVSALLFLIPKTNSLGLLLLSGYMGGAIVTHMQNGEPYFAQSILLVLVWLAGYLRHPEVLQSFRSSA